MAPLLLDDDLDIFYTDTDSAKSTQKITKLERYNYLVLNSFGGLKYEENLQDSIYIFPKVSGGILESSKKVIKMKRFKYKVEFNLLKNLLNSRESLSLNQDK